MTNQSKATHSISTSIGTGDFFPQDTAGTSSGTHEDGIAPITVAASNAWDDVGIFQMLDREFLDPSWLEDVQV